MREPAPVAGTTVLEDQTVAVHVNASDDTGVASVALFANGIAAGTDTTAPYDFSFIVPDGVTSIVFTARATDLVGHATTSAGVQIAATPVNDAPVITLPRGGGAGGTARVGYYDMSSGQGVAVQVPPITAIYEKYWRPLGFFVASSSSFRSSSNGFEQ